MSIVEKAFESIDRKDFVQDDYIKNAESDSPLPIGFGQTISQPFTVKKMLMWLDAQPGDKVLDVGSGSGWTAALLSKIIGSDGDVYAVEKIPELLEFGRQNCQKAGIRNAKFFLAIQKLGLPEYAPYDRILVSAAAEGLPISLVDQLKVYGKMVVPVRNDVLEIEKTGPRKISTTPHPGFRFVPLV